MIRTNDPIQDFLNYDYEQYIKEISRPVCCECGDYITDEYLWDFHGMYYCEKCMRDHRERIDD